MGLLIPDQKTESKDSQKKSHLNVRHLRVGTMKIEKLGTVPNFHENFRIFIDRHACRHKIGAMKNTDGGGNHG